MHTEVTTVPGQFQNVLESTQTGSADFIELAGQANPVMVWDALPDPSFPDLPEVLPPDLWFVGD